MLNLDALFTHLANFLSGPWWQKPYPALLSFVDFLRPYSLVLSLLFLTGIVYAFLRIELLIEETYHEDVPRAQGSGGVHGSPATDESLSLKEWQRIKARLDSEKESDWRLSVLEADVLLDRMLTTLGYRGDSVGEKLKAIEQSDFLTLDKAWDAHNVRNRIAHEGAAFALTKREAQRVIGLFEEAFREFHYI